MEHNFTLFQPIHKIITAFSGLPDTISECESKVFSNNKIMSSYTTNKSLSGMV